jgi:hypothetical protein
MKSVVFRIAIELKTRVGVILDFCLVVWIWELVMGKKSLEL